MGVSAGLRGVVANPWNRQPRKGLDPPPYKRPPRTAEDRGDNQGKSLGLNHAGYLRNCRGIAEFKWCRAMLANGGVEPIEWAPELEPTSPSEHGTLS